jgi:glycosyltransferase involved in cell wall biosynthesis
VLEGKRVAVVVPARNEEARIGPTLATLPAFVDLTIVVDDASADRTGEAALEARPSAVVVRHDVNRGVGAAIASGYRSAIDLGAEVIAVMAGDGQMDPDDLARIVHPVASGRADYTKGDRFSHPDIMGSMPAHRRVLGKMLSAMTRRAAGLEHLSDSQSGFTAISNKALARIDLDALYPRYGYPNDLIGSLARAGCSIEDVVVRPVYRGEKSGLRPWHLAIVCGIVARVYARRIVG